MYYLLFPTLSPTHNLPEIFILMMIAFIIGLIFGALALRVRQERAKSYRQEIQSEIPLPFIQRWWGLGGVVIFTGVMVAYFLPMFKTMS